MKNLLNHVYDLLKQDERLVSTEGDLLKNKIQELTYKLDEGLITLLLSDERTKKEFFVNIGEVVIFDQKKFVEFVNNKEFLPDSYTAYKNKIGLKTGHGQMVSESGDVVLDRPYKDCILAGGQDKEDSKRDEIFYNEVLGSDQIDRLLDLKAFTNFKKYTTDGEQDLEDFTRDDEGTIKDNLIIKGNNLLALHSLKKEFTGKIKLIYADPPYNTGGATDVFKYNNTFKHSTWLTFMKNRLISSRDLLSDDGFLALTIDHEELFYLGTLADEIFGKNNRVGIVTVYINPKGRQHERFFSASTEYMLVYAKNIQQAEFRKVTIDAKKAETFTLSDEVGNYRLESFIRARTNTLRENKPNFRYPIYVSSDLSDISDFYKDGYLEIFPIQNNREFTWKTNKGTFIKRNDKNYFVAEKDKNGVIQILHKYREQQVFKNIWLDKKYFSEFNGTNIVKKLLGDNVFSYPKSLYAVMDIVKIITSNDDIVLDFFGGSGTTAHAVLELNKEDGGNRQFILTEQMDYINTVTAPRVQKVMENNGDGEFIYMELAQNNEKLIQAIQDSDEIQELVDFYRQLKDSSFINYAVDIQAIDDTLSEFESLSLDNQKRFLIELIDKNALYINYSEMNDESYTMSEADKTLNRKFYQ